MHVCMYSIAQEVSIGIYCKKVAMIVLFLEDRDIAQELYRNNIIVPHRGAYTMTCNIPAAI